MCKSLNMVYLLGVEIREWFNLEWEILIMFKIQSFIRVARNSVFRTSVIFGFFRATLGFICQKVPEISGFNSVYNS
jgi:hypothetical protein